MLRLFGSLLVGFIMQLGISSSSFAMRFECQRVDQTDDNITRSKWFETYYPSNLDFHINSFKRKPGRKLLEFANREIPKWNRLATDGTLFRRVGSGSASVPSWMYPQKYKCNMTAEEVILAQASARKSQPVDSSSSTQSNISKSAELEAERRKRINLEQQVDETNSSIQVAKNWNLTSGDKKTKKPNRIDLSGYDKFRTLKFEIGGLAYDSFAAFEEGKNLFGFYAKGLWFYGNEICNWKSNITDRKTKSGSFEASCPSGLTVDGRYTYVGNLKGSYGSGIDSKGRDVSFVLGPTRSSSKYEIEQYYLNYFAPKPMAIPAPANTASQSAELKAERQKRIKLEQQLAALEAKQQKQKKTISNDVFIPVITASSRDKDEATSIIFGTVTDDTGVASLTVAGEVVELAADGSFQTPTYVPASGLEVEIVAYDLKGNKASKTLALKRNATQSTLTQTFDKLRPSLGKRGKTNNAALALIVGIETYEYFPSSPAIYADSDAQYFADYAHYKLGVPRGNIITAINADAEALDIRKAITKITRQSKKDKTDVFVFFAGHGLASDDETEDVYLLPYDGDKDYLDETSLTRGEVFKLVERIKPRSVTVFLDACYSGATRSEDKVLVADKRRVGLKFFKQAVPEGFTVLSAAAANETSMALEEAKHGLFSYYLMRGMEGDADTNQDDKITMNEMRDYVKDKVGRQSDFKQTPQLQGDENRVLVQFQ